MNSIKNESIMSETNLTASDNSSMISLSLAESGAIQVVYTITTGDSDFQLQLSNDGTNWSDQGSAVNKTGSGSHIENLTRDICGAGFARIAVTMNSGQIDQLDIRMNIKGDN
jgi:hypothetical protein